MANVLKPNINDLSIVTSITDSMYICIGNGSIKLGDLRINMNDVIYETGQIVFKQSSDKIITEIHGVFILLDGTDYRGTPYETLHNFFGRPTGDLPNCLDDVYGYSVLGYRESANITPPTYKKHRHILNINDKVVNIGTNDTIRKLPGSPNYGYSLKSPGNFLMMSINKLKGGSVNFDSVAIDVGESNTGEVDYIAQQNTLINPYIYLRNEDVQET